MSRKSKKKKQQIKEIAAIHADQPQTLVMPDIPPELLMLSDCAESPKSNTDKQVTQDVPEVGRSSNRYPCKKELSYLLNPPKTYVYDDWRPGIDSEEFEVNNIRKAVEWARNLRVIGFKWNYGSTWDLPRLAHILSGFLAFYGGRMSQMSRCSVNRSQEYILRFPNRTMQYGSLSFSTVGTFHSVVVLCSPKLRVYINKAYCAIDCRYANAKYPGPYLHHHGAAFGQVLGCGFTPMSIRDREFRMRVDRIRLYDWLTARKSQWVLDPVSAVRFTPDDLQYYADFQCEIQSATILDNLSFDEGEDRPALLGF